MPAPAVATNKDGHDHSDTNDVVVTGGVDTHQDLHVAAALDQLGRLLGTHAFPTTAAGYRQLLAWLPGTAGSSGSASRAPAVTGPPSPGT